MWAILSPWNRRRRAGQAHAAAMAAAERVQQAEREAARQRLLNLARTPANWHTPTMPLSTTDRPLMTPAAEWRSSGTRR